MNARIRIYCSLFLIWDLYESSVRITFERSLNVVAIGLQPWLAVLYLDATERSMSTWANFHPVRFQYWTIPLSLSRKLSQTWSLLVFFRKKTILGCVTFHLTPASIHDFGFVLKNRGTWWENRPYKWWRRKCCLAWTIQSGWMTVTLL